ncbi:MAG: rhomboid family intramembrane serine protease [Sedimentisphaerales bacterium]|nr:rhomboid family intramembrane serine protease [Sedimentisphaerales bacterium]
MLLPIRTSIQPRRTPYANYALIAINVLIFLISYWPHRVGLRPGMVYTEPLRNWAQQLMLHPANAYLWQFITYAFLHGSMMHILGNMYFLYLFGNNVNDKLGHIGYVCLYLAGGVFSGIGHMLFNHVTPVLGASGAVAAITGAYLVLFPRTLITIVYWFYIIGTLEISALYFIAFKLILWDNVFEPSLARQAVAYEAHVAGYSFGIAASFLLLAFGLIDRSYTDLWFMIRQWNRRRHFRDAVSDGYDPFSPQKAAKRVSARVAGSPEQQAKTDLILQARSEIVNLINDRNLASAADKYMDLTELDPNQVLPQQYQLDIANQLMSTSRWAESAHAYEAFLGQYPRYPHIEQIHLMLGILYCRYLDRSEEAKKYLELARTELTDPGQIRMCQEELNRLRQQ